jgi:hypothetical protein
VEGLEIERSFGGRILGKVNRGEENRGQDYRGWGSKRRDKRGRGEVEVMFVRKYKGGPRKKSSYTKEKFEEAVRGGLNARKASLIIYVPKATLQYIQVRYYLKP